MNFDLEALIKERIRKATDTLIVAKLPASENHWNSAVNRLYYSAFYAVLALLAKMKAKTSTHSGAKSEFYRLFKRQVRSTGNLVSYIRISLVRDRKVTMRISLILLRRK